uniref:Uncharacterized protein n=1 Tax=Panagrolaimus sp. PS1159 TaxID=55785 RepID=A0AC35GAE5_9BILA
MAKKEDPTKSNDSDFMIVEDEQMKGDPVEAASSPSRTPFPATQICPNAASSPSRTPFPAKQPCPNGDKFPDDITLIIITKSYLIDPHNLKIRLNAVMQIITK